MELTCQDIIHVLLGNLCHARFIRTKFIYYDPMPVCCLPRKAHRELSYKTLIYDLVPPIGGRGLPKVKRYSFSGKWFVIPKPCPFQL